MRAIGKLKIFAIFWLLALWPATALRADATREKDTLTWLTLDWQPAWIMEGPLKGLGYAEISGELLKKALPQYEHREEPVINVRIYDILKARNACFSASSYRGGDLAGSRRDHVISSAPSFLFFYHGVIAPTSLRPRLAPYMRGGKIVFLDLLADRSLVGAFQPGRNYSAWLNSVFADESKTEGMFRWSSTIGLTTSMFKMLDAGRFDYFTDYSMLLNYHEMETQQSGDFVFLPLVEHDDRPYGLGAIVCSNTPRGRKVIAHINEALASVRLTEAYAAAFSRWLMPKGLEDRYWTIWREEILPRYE